MVQTASTMLELGTRAPDFSLPDVSTGEIVTREQFKGHPLLVLFICAHCPFVKHIENAVADLVKSFSETALRAVAISSNSIQTHPQDAPEKLAEQAAACGFTMPYLYDESQDVARSYTAACTPDFFLFDADHRLVYRGQFDSARPGNGVPVTGSDLRMAIERTLAGEPIPDEQMPSIGCNIKWHPGKEPAYFGG